MAAEVARLEDRCLMSTLKFDGYDWSTNYRHNLAGTGWYSSGQQWAPQNAFVNSDGLHLVLTTATVDRSYTAMSSAEVDLVGKGGQPFNPGYGTYLVAASTKGGFNELAKDRRSSSVPSRIRKTPTIARSTRIANWT